MNSLDPIRKRPCYETHPVLELFKGTISGGSCVYPELNVDYTIGFDYHMTMPMPLLPWQTRMRRPQEVFFPIADQRVPEGVCVEEYKHLVRWGVTQLKAAYDLHAGCLGGHGRTGLYLAALVAEGKLDPDPIGWVRKHYCPKAVESLVQVQFLVKHYGCPARAPRPMELSKSKH